MRKNIRSFTSKIVVNNISIINTHCAKSVHIPSFSGPYSPAFGLNTVSPNRGKYGPGKLGIWTLFTQWVINILESIFVYHRTHSNWPKAPVSFATTAAASSKINFFSFFVVWYQENLNGISIKFLLSSVWK